MNKSRGRLVELKEENHQKPGIEAKRHSEARPSNLPSYPKAWSKVLLFEEKRIWKSNLRKGNDEMEEAAEEKAIYFQ